MNAYDYLVSIGEQTAKTLEVLMHDIGSLFLVFFPVILILSIVCSVIDHYKGGRK